MRTLIFWGGLVVSIFVFQRCSWVEYFVVINESDKAIYVQYELNNDVNGFPIFYDHPNVFPLNSSDKIEWGLEIGVSDEDTLLHKVAIALPPRSALVFGSLYNSSYKSYDQQFINGRQFNLQKLQLLQGNKILEIVPSNFDKHFKKKQGNIFYKVE